MKNIYMVLKLLRGFMQNHAGLKTCARRQEKHAPDRARQGVFSTPSKVGDGGQQKKRKEGRQQRQRRRRKRRKRE
jgi:hypothetical protein